MKVYLYVPNTMADWEIGFLTAELNSRRYFKDKTNSVEIIKVGPTRMPVVTMGGLSVTPDQSIEEIAIGDDDLLLLPGADTWLNEENRTVLLLAKKRIENGLKVAAICGATLGLAKEGALDKIKHTSIDKNYLKMICPQYAGEEFYQKELALTEKNLITASGIAPLEFTYEVLKMLGVFKASTLEAWYNLYNTKEDRYYFELMSSLNA